MRIEIQEHGVMLSDYFQGTSGVMLSLNIDNTTTKKQIFEMLEQEIISLFDHIEYVAGWNDYKGNFEDDIAEELLRIKGFVKGDFDTITFPDLEFCFDGMDEDIDLENYAKQAYELI